MDPKLAELILSVFSRIMQVLRVQNDTDMVFNQAVAANQKFDFIKDLGGPVRYLKIEATNNCALLYQMVDRSRNKTGDVRIYPWGLTAGVVLEVEDENWGLIEVRPVAFPTTLMVYASTVLVTKDKVQTAR